MFALRILLYIVFASALYFVEIRGDVVGAPNIAWQDVHVTIFDKEKRNFEKDLYESMQEHKQGLTVDLSGRIVVGVVNMAAGAVPLIGGFFQFLLSFADMLSSTSDWQASLSKNIVNVVELTTAQAKASDLVARIHSIHNSLGLADTMNKEMIVWDTRKDLDYMMNIFDASDSIFKKYPAMGAPILINLSKMIAQLSRDINNPFISCKMRNILMEYRSRTLDARLDEITLNTILDGKLAAPYWNYKIYQQYDMVFVRAHVMTLEYSKSIKQEFSKSNRWTCKQTDIPNYSDAYYKKMKGVHMPRNYELVDKYGGTYTIPHNIHCAVEYFTYVRHVIEEMFNIESFDNACGRKDSLIPTDRGYLTFKIKTAGVGNFDKYTTTTANFQAREIAPYMGYDIFAQLYIDGKIVYTTKKLHTCFQCDFNEVYHSGLINKNAKIMVETRQIPRKGTLDGSTDIVVRGDRTSGTIDDYSRHGLRLGMTTKEGAFTYIESTAIWQPEFNLNPIASMFLAAQKDGSLIQQK